MENNTNPKLPRIKWSFKGSCLEEDSLVQKITDYIHGCGRLGTGITISPKSNAFFNDSGSRREYFTETVTVIIGIGNNHTAELIMSHEAWVALNKGEKVSIDTNKEFRKQYLESGSKLSKLED